MLDKMRVIDCMEKRNILFTENQTINEVVSVLIDKEIPGGSVVDGKGTLIGVISENDCLKATIGNLYYDQPYGTVKDYMNTEITGILGKSSLMDLAEIFLKIPAHCYPVLDDNRHPIGVISRRNILAAIKRHQEAELKNGPLTGHRG